MTFAERKVGIDGIKSNLSNAKADLAKQYSEISDQIVTKMLAQVSTAVETNDYDKIMELQAKNKQAIADIVTANYKKMFDYGKNEASREIGAQIP